MSLEHVFFKECCLNYSDLVTKSEMVRSLRWCADQLDVKPIRKQLREYRNPVFDIGTFDYIVMHQITNCRDYRRAKRALRNLADFIEGEVDWQNGEHKLDEVVVFLTADTDTYNGTTL